MLVQHHGVSKKDCYEVKREVPDRSRASKIATKTSKQKDQMILWLIDGKEESLELSVRGNSKSTCRPIVADQTTR